MLFDRIDNLIFKSLDTSHAKTLIGGNIPGGRAFGLSNGVQLPSFTLRGQIYATCYEDARRKAMQLNELIDNPEYPFHYIRFNQPEKQYDGFYLAGSIAIPREYEWRMYEFEMPLQKLGDLHTHIPAQYWTVGAETYTGWATLTATSMISMPYRATDIDFAVASTRTAKDGSNQILENPTFQTLMFTPSNNIKDWYRAECKVFDSGTPGETDETRWMRVFGTEHNFEGDIIIQNGMLRYKIASSAGTFYGLDTATLWKSAGQFKTALTGNLDATIKHVDFIRVSPDEVRWFERRHYGADRLYIEYTLRRGAYHCRVKIDTKSLGIGTATYVQLYKAGGFTKLFNSTVNGNAGAGDLNQDATKNYECGYNTTDDMVVGFALCDQPTKQPYDPGAAGNYLPASLTWGTGTQRTIFVMAFPQDTGTFDLGLGRVYAASNAAYCMRSVDQRGDLVPGNWKV
jgi:hypothetical protein